MLVAILVILILLWFFGYIHVSGLPSLPNITLFTINNHAITLWDVLILAVICWAIGVLPSPLRQIAGALLLVWILATLGILAIVGLAQIVVLVIIVGIILALLGVV